MNTPEARAKSTAPNPMIYFTINLASLVAFETPLAWAFSDHVSATIARALREKGIAAKDEPCVANGFTPSYAVDAVITRKSQTIGFFQVNDWRAGVATVRAELGKLGFLSLSEIGWHDSELILRIVYPSPSERLLQPVFDLMHQWIDEMKSALQPPPTNPPAL